MTTRYPKGGKGRKWTAIELKNIPADWKGDTLSEEGLQGEVRVNQDGGISIRWKTAFKWEGKLSWFYCGSSPHDSMEDIRNQSKWCRAQVKAGLNPNQKKVADKLEAQAQIAVILAEEERKKTEALTLKDLVDSWLESGVRRKDGNKEIRSALTKYLLNPLKGGEIPLRIITDSDLSKGLLELSKAGKNRQLVRVCQDTKTMFRWAEQRKPWRALLIEGNPAALLDPKRFVQADYDIDHASDRVLSDDELREIRDIFRRSEEEYQNAPNKRKARQPLEKKSQIAVWICLGTLCRIGELTMARWEHVDFENRTWFIPKENTKKTKGKRQDHRIFLSDFALGQFKKLHELTGQDEWLFPSPTSAKRHHIATNAITKQISNRQSMFLGRNNGSNLSLDNSLVLAEGKTGQWTPHDMRRTGATLMQKLGIDPNVIDRCQNHVLAGSKVRRHYLHHDYAEEMEKAWSALGAHLQDALQNETQDRSDNINTLPVRAS